ncbi:MAG: hypothetical protein RLT30_05870, partial [Gammaproteobacteria bacterium]
MSLSYMKIDPGRCGQWRTRELGTECQPPVVDTWYSSRLAGQMFMLESCKFLSAHTALCLADSLEFIPGCT